MLYKKILFGLIIVILVVALITNTGACLYLDSTFKTAVTDKKEIDVIKTYYPQVSDVVISNPYMGLVPDARTKEEELYQPFNLVYAGISWKELEPEEGVYDFESFEEENNFGYWKSNNKKIIIRFFMDYPSPDGIADIPEWLYKKIGKDGAWYAQSESKGFSPNYNNKILIEYHNKIIKQLAKKYDNDSAIAFIELGSIGHWGEWHTSIVNKKNYSFPKAEISDIYVRHYIDNFKNIKLLMRRPYKIALDNNLGLFNDSFGDVEQTDEYFLNWIKNGYVDHNVNQTHPGMPQFWKSAPSGGEFAQYPGDVFLSNKNVSKTLKMLKDSHTSWLGPSSPITVNLDPEKKKNLDMLLKLMGYHFSITKSTYTEKLSPGKLLEGTVEIKNSGVAPFYFDWPMVVKISDMSGQIKKTASLDYDIRKLLPGTGLINYKVGIDNGMAAGIYKLNFMINDPNTGTAEIAFANISSKEKEYELGDFIVTMPAPYVCDDFSMPSYYNYISYNKGKIIINAKAKKDILSKDIQYYDNSTFIYREIHGSNNWDSNITFSDISEELENISFALNNSNENINLFSVIREQGSQPSVMLISDNGSLSLELPLNLKISKKGKYITVYSISPDDKLEKIISTQISAEMKKSKLKVGLNLKFNSKKTEYKSIIDKFEFK